MAMKQYTDQELQEQFERREKVFAQTLSVQRMHVLLFEPYNISHSEHRALAFLLFSGGSEPSVMADSLMILRQTMTKIIDSLEAKGLAVRTEHPSDRRRLYVTLLPKGVEIARELLNVETDFLDRVDERIPQKDMDDYHRTSALVQKTRVEVLNEVLAERAAKQE